MALAAGQTYTLKDEIATGSAPGQSQYKAAAGSQLKVKNTRTVGGQLYYDIDQTAFGGGTGWTLGSSLEGAVGGAAPAPGPINDLVGSNSPLNKTLNDYQSNLFQTATAPQVRSTEQIRAEVQPATPYPEAPNYLKMFDEAREKFGVTGLEGNLNELKGQQDEVLAQRRQRLGIEEGKPVPMNVIEGRISEVDRQEGERLDTMQRAISRITDQLNTAYSGINQVMQLTKMTYDDAAKAWDSEFNQNMSIYGLAKDSRQEVRDEVHYQQQMATANLQTFTNLLASGNLSYDQFSPEQKTQVAKLSVQAGFPPNFLTSVQMSPKDKMLFANQETGQVVFLDANGNAKVQSIPGYTPPAKAGATSPAVADFVSKMWGDSINKTAASDIASIWNGNGAGASSAAGGPNFTPKDGIGSVWVDPTKGSRWIFTESGWVMI